MASFKTPETEPFCGMMGSRCDPGDGVIGHLLLVHLAKPHELPHMPSSMLRSGAAVLSKAWAVCSETGHRGARIYSWTPTLVGEGWSGRL